MKSLLRKFLNGAIFGLGMVVSIWAVDMAWAVGPGINPANPILLFTGPSGTNPANQPNLIGDLNTLINSMNNEVFNYLSLGNGAGEAGELSLTSGNAFSVNTSCGTLTGSMECLLVVDETGRVGHIPVY